MAFPILNGPERRLKTFMDDTSRHPDMMPNVRLGVRGLPSLTNTLTPGGLYVLVAETASARFPLLGGSLDAALKDGRRCSVVVPGNPELHCQRMEAAGDVKLARPLASGQLQVFVAQDEFPKKMFRYGADGFVKELEQFGVDAHGYLIFDQADDLISLHDISLATEQIDILARWARERQVTALLVFLRLTEAHAAHLNALMDNLSGIAHLGSDEEGLRLNFDYWQSPEGAVVARHYALSAGSTGMYEVVQRAVPASEVAATNAGAGSAASSLVAPPPTGEPPSYFYMDPDLGSLEALMPGHWQQVDSLVGMMHATRQHRAPVVIFCYRPDTALRLLTEAVHTLRVNLGPYAQLIVQEKNASLRYQNEALLLRLGLNLVIHRDVQTERIPLLLGSLAGQMFNRDVDIDFEAALASVTPSHVRGYQPPLAFVREVRALLDRSSMLNIPFVLLTGLPAQEQSILDVLSLMKLSRGGDLVTADTRHCYVFLHACQQQVALVAMERILGTAVDEVFEIMTFQVTREEVELQLEALMHNASAGMALDYTAQLPKRDAQAALREAVPAPVPSATRVMPRAETASVSAIDLRAMPALPVATPQQAAKSPVAPAKRAKPRADVMPAPAAGAAPLEDPRVMGAAASTEADTQLTPYRRNAPAVAVYGREAAPRAQRKVSGR